MTATYPRQPFARYLTDNGQPNGSPEIIVDWSQTPGPFFLLPPADRTYFVTRMIVEVEGDPASTFHRQGYGSSLTGLTGGPLRLRIGDSGPLPIVEWPHPIKRMTDWLAFGAEPGNPLTHVVINAPIAYFNIDLTAIAGEQPIRLRGAKQENLQLFLDGRTDDLNLVHHRVQVFGVEVEE